MKKVVIVSLATYPSQTPRTFRTHELARELAKQGHDVTLYVLSGGYNYKDYEKEHGLKVKSLGRTYFFNYDHKNNIKLNLFGKVLKKFFKKLLEFPVIELATNTFNVLKKERNIDLLITIAVPYPIHWGAALCRVFYRDNYKNTTWVADCGDPYMGNTFHKRFFYFKYIENFFCSQANYISIPVESARSAYYPQYHEKIRVIPQGFNFDEFEGLKTNSKNSSPIFIYAGTFYPKLRDPRPLLDYLLTLDIDFEFRIYTKTREMILPYVDKFKGKLIILDYIPRAQLMLEMSKADFLLNLENLSDVQSPSKLIDYSLSGKPILNINTNKEFSKEIIDEFLQGSYKNQYILPNIESYNIRNVAKQFLDLSS